MSDADRDSKRLADILQSGELPDLAEFAHLLGLGDEYLRPKKVPSRKPAMQTLERLHADLHGRIFNNRAEGEALWRKLQQVEAVLKMLDQT
ncbi:MULTISPECIES: hypothetical protein [Bradyrhizobium]|uniref:hypothetical protein n=1 Tax=Bradyrhizobium TaxID=374 RepID=UPI00048721F1|nr:hypothetical protein [Bradyrhizobium japonicum]WLB85940.1 hypothetical protein QIH91_23650 [Bradyrhizobium japonicum USDA 135]